MWKNSLGWDKPSWAILVYKQLMERNDLIVATVKGDPAVNSLYLIDKWYWHQDDLIESFGILILKFCLHFAVKYSQSMNICHTLRALILYHNIKTGQLCPELIKAAPRKS